MTQLSIQPADGSGLAYEGNVNDAMKTLATLFSGPSAPATTYEYQYWADTTAKVLKQRNSTNTDWVIRNSIGDAVILTKSANYTVELKDMGCVILVDASAGNVVLSLPALTGVPDGFRFSAYRIDGTANTIAITANGANLINGLSSIALSSQFDSIEAVTNTVAWYAESNATIGSTARVATTVGGTADAITGAFSPAIIALTDGMEIRFRAASANTANSPTFKADGTAVKTIKKTSTAAVLKGAIQPGQEVTLRYNLSLDVWIIESVFSFGAPRKAVYNAPGYFTVPAGIQMVYITLCGAGGGGAGFQGGTTGGGGGGGGQTLMAQPYACSPGDVIAYYPGFGGPGGAAGVNGTNGEAAYFDTITALGGAGGTGTTGGTGGASGASPNAATTSGAGANGSGGLSSAPGMGGGSAFGAATPAGGSNVAGYAGRGYGHGGNGGYGAQYSGAGGPGSNGFVEITY